MTYDYSVIGGGISGMTAALILAKQGYRVALVEKSRYLAPTIRGFTNKGVYFDTGFHYTGGLGDGEPLDIMFRYLGLYDTVRKKPFRRESFDFFHCLNPDFDFDFPYGYRKLLDKFHRTFPAEKKAIDTYFGDVRELYHAIPYITLDTSPDKVKPVARNVTLQEYLDGITGNELLKCILSMHCFLYGVSPDEASFANHAYVAGSYYESVSGIEGGGKSLSMAFERQLGRTGVVDLFLGQAVKEIGASKAGTVSGIVLEDGRTVDCDGCICTIHPRQLVEIVPAGAFRPAYVTRMKELEETALACVLYAQCTKAPADLDGRNIFIFPEADFSFFNRNRAMERQPMYITSAGFDKAPETGRGIIAISPIPRELAASLMEPDSQKRSADYEQIKGTITEGMLSVIRNSLPHIAEIITDVICATPLTLRDYANSPFGSLYGVKHKAGQVNPLPVTRMKGLFLAGQAVTAPGIMGAMMSAFLVCGGIIGHEKLQGELRQCR